MILTTVRSSLESEGLGFLVNDKRFNVAVTRAQAIQVRSAESFYQFLSGPFQASSFLSFEQLTTNKYKNIKIADTWVPT